jgi:hypothetical protein
MKLNKNLAVHVDINFKDKGTDIKGLLIHSDFFKKNIHGIIS